MFQGTVTGMVSSIHSQRNDAQAIDVFEFYLIESFYSDKLKFQRVWFVSVPEWKLKTAEKMVKQGWHIGVNFKQIRPDSYKGADGQVRACLSIEVSELFYL